MSKIERLTVTMPIEMAATLRESVDGGEYASTSEIVREAVRDWTRKRDAEHLAHLELRALIRAGAESGPGVPAEEVYTDLKRLIAERRTALS